MSVGDARALEERLRQWADSHGYGIAWGDAALVAEVQDRVRQRYAEGELDDHFATNALAGAIKPLLDAPAGTAICVAVPRPAHRVTFATANGPFTAIAPPTYVNYGTVMNAVQRDIEALLQPAQVASLRSKPLKSLAVRLGLARYGRNNVTYTPRTGRYHELTALVTDAYLDPWPGLQGLETVLPQCSTCEACQQACPTGAIGNDRFLIHAERCVTFLNEFTGDWPAWLPKDAHSALLGCMHCISACPVNRGRLRIDDFPQTFTVAETEAILSGRTDGNELVWKSIADKLAAADCNSWLDVLSRNLKALMGMSHR